MPFGRNLFVAGSHQILAVFMVAGERIHGPNRCDLIELLSQRGQELAQLKARHIGGYRACLALVFMARLQVECVKMRHATVHKQVDQTLGFATECRCSLSSVDGIVERWKQADTQCRLGCVLDKAPAIQTTKF